jgi:hypothetical protein
MAAREAELQRPFVDHPQVFVCHLDAPWENPLREAEALIRRINPTAVVLGITEDQFRAVRELKRIDLSTIPRAFLFLFGSSRTAWQRFDEYCFSSSAYVFHGLTRQPAESWPPLANARAVVQAASEAGISVHAAEAPRSWDAFSVELGDDRRGFYVLQRILDVSTQEQPNPKDFAEFRLEGAQLMEDLTYPGMGSPLFGAECVRYVLGAGGFQPEDRVLAVVRRRSQRAMEARWHHDIDEDFADFVDNADNLLPVSATRGLTVATFAAGYAALRWRVNGFQRQSRLAKWTRRAWLTGGVCATLGVLGVTAAVSSLHEGLACFDELSDKMVDNPQARWHYNILRLKKHQQEGRS